MKNQVEEQIWALEEEFEAHMRDGDPDQSFAMLHDQLLVWATPAPLLADKKTMVCFLEKDLSEAGSYSCEFERVGIRVLGNIAITQFLERFTGKTSAGADFKETLQVTHTWINENSEWKLLGGMSYEIGKTR